MVDMTIENIVAFAQISNSLDIKMLSERLSNCIYNPDEFHGLTMKVDESKMAVLILSNGRVICTGAKDIKDAKKAINKTAEKIKEVDSNVKKDYVIAVDNIVTSADFKKKLDLKRVLKNLPSENVNYEPKNFPGLIYKADKDGPVLILFESGKVVCTGIKTENNAYKAVKILEKKLKTSGVM